MIINVNKPRGYTSFGVVKLLKKWFKEKKAGHLGTLDPLASGVLPVFLGKSTKLIPLFNQTDKVYRATLKLGERTDTFDSEGEILEKKDITFLTEGEVCSTVHKYQGTHTQLTPIYSAVKIGGVPAYHFARQGKEVPRKSREIDIHSIEIEKVHFPFVQIKIACSKGTYIRSLADDIGNDLQVGAHLVDLQRLACGRWFTIEKTWNIEDLEKWEHHESLPETNVLEVLSHLHTAYVNADNLSRIRHGQTIDLRPDEVVFHGEKEDFSNPLIKAVDIQQKLIAIGHINMHGGCYQLKPTKVLI